MQKFYAKNLIWLAATVSSGVILFVGCWVISHQQTSTPNEICSLVAKPFSGKYAVQFLLSQPVFYLPLFLNIIILFELCYNLFIHSFHLLNCFR